MLLRHLRYFATVADEGSVLRAAVKLRIAQPALSRQVRQLEDEIGIKLFERERHGVQLTTAGMALLDGVRRLSEKLDAAVAEARRADEGNLGVIRVGVGRSAVANPRITSAFDAVRAALPDATLVLNELPLGAQAEALRSGDVDMVIGSGVHEAGDFRDDVLYTIVVDSVLVPDRGDLPSDGVLDIAKLKGEAGWLVASVIPRLPQLVARLRELGLTYETVGSEETALALIASGRGWIPTAASFAGAAPPGTRVLQTKKLHVEMPMAIRTRATDDSRLLDNVRRIMTSSASHSKGAPSRTVRGSGAARAPAPHAMHIELRQLRALIVAIQEHSLTRAARRLGLSQSAVSRQLQALEREVGVHLLRRPVRDVTPTVAGRLFAREAQALLAVAETTVERTRRVASGVTGTCLIGTLASEITNGVLPGKLRALHARHPEVAVEVREMITSEQIRALLDHKIDVGLIGSLHQEFDDSALTLVALSEDPIEAVLMTADHPLAKRTWLRARDLSGCPFVFMPRHRNAVLYDAVLRGLAQAGVIPNTGNTYFGVRVMWDALGVTGGWSIASRSLLTNPPRGMVVRALEGFNVPWGLRLAWRRDESDAAVKKVLDVFRE